MCGWDQYGCFFSTPEKGTKSPFLKSYREIKKKRSLIGNDDNDDGENDKSPRSSFFDVECRTPDGM